MNIKLSREVLLLCLFVGASFIISMLMHTLKERLYLYKLEKQIFQICKQHGFFAEGLVSRQLQ